MKKIGFFGGTFDPPHFGHENLAISLKEQAGIDHVFVCPTSISPLKDERPIATDEQRLTMVKQSLGQIPGFEVIENEMGKNEVIYTIDTITSIIQEHTESEFFLFLGADHIPLLSQWKEIEKLFTITTPLFGGRPGFVPQLPKELSEEIKKRIENGLYSIPQFDISATDIRHRLAEELYCGHLLQAKVLDFIYEHSIYFSD